MHGVRVTRAETDKVLRSEVVRLSHDRRLLLPRHRHELECNQLTLTWKTHVMQETSNINTSLSKHHFSKRLIAKRFTFNGNVFHLAVVAHNSENLTALVSSGGKENHLKTHTCLKTQRIYRI